MPRICRAKRHWYCGLLYDDKIVITFNYQNGTKTVTFAELEVSGILSELAENGEPKKALAFQQVLFCFSLNPQLRNPSNLLTAWLFFCYNNCRMVKWKQKPKNIKIEALDGRCPPVRYLFLTQRDRNFFAFFYLKKSKNRFFWRIQTTKWRFCCLYRWKDVAQRKEKQMNDQEIIQNRRKDRWSPFRQTVYHRIKSKGNRAWRLRLSGLQKDSFHDGGACRRRNQNAVLHHSVQQRGNILDLPHKRGVGSDTWKERENAVYIAWKGESNRFAGRKPSGRRKVCFHEGRAEQKSGPPLLDTGMLHVEVWICL